MRRRLTISIDPEKYAEHAKVWALWGSLPDYRRATIVIDALLHCAPEIIATHHPEPRAPVLSDTYEFAAIELGENLDAR